MIRVFIVSWFETAVNEFSSVAKVISARNLTRECYYKQLQGLDYLDSFIFIRKQLQSFTKISFKTFPVPSYTLNLTILASNV